MSLVGPLTSFLDSDGDLSKTPQFSAYSSGGDKSPGLSRSTDSLRNKGCQSAPAKPQKGTRFSDAELKILR